MNLVRNPGEGTVNLQATLSASSATGPFGTSLAAHHPITCAGDLRFEDDGSFSCEHASVPPDDTRTQFCLDHSIALLLMELVDQL